MQEFLSLNYEWFRAFHLIAVISWMAGMLYLPRLFVYHASVENHTPQSETFKIMEQRLLRYIMNPAMVAAWGIGLLMLYANPAILQDQGWMHAKLLLALILSGLHGYFAVIRKKFSRGENICSARFYRILNEAPTVLMILIIILAVVEPF